MSATVIIGERLNSSIDASRTILEKRDREALLDLAGRQIEGGAGWLDVNASMLRGAELDTLLWAGSLILERFEAGICADSPDLQILRACASAFGSRCLLNSITADGDSLEAVLPAAARSGASVIVMLKTDDGIPATAGERLVLAGRAAEAAERAGIPPERLYLDPVFQPIATGSDLGIVLETLDLLSGRHPDCPRVGGLSNVSFGLPMRRLVNRVFLAMAVSRGLSAVICDPTDGALLDALAASETLSGLDPGCRRLLGRYRARRGTGR